MMFSVPQASLHCNALKYVYFTVLQHVVKGHRLETLTHVKCSRLHNMFHGMW